MRLKAMNRIKEEIKEPSNLTDVYTMTIYRCKYCDHLTFDSEAYLRTHTQQVGIFFKIYSFFYNILDIKTAFDFICDNS